MVGAFEVHAVAAADGGVAEGGGEEGLADPDGAEDQRVVAGVDEAQRAQLVPDCAVVGDLGGVVPVLEASWRGRGRRRGPAGRREVVSRRVTSSASTSSKNSAWARSLVLARARRSGRVSRQRPSLTRRSRALSSGVTAGAGVVMPHRLDPASSLVADRRSGSGFAGEARRVASDAVRPAGSAASAVVACFGGPFDHAGRSSPTLNASASSAWAQAASTRSGPHRLTRPNRA